ncbi:hypothetical protein [Vibrio cholerae]|uniref:hypothetical protein n=1 Tax=Vibrio cholerae TaxID=666 RepID=UPI0030809D1A
MKTIKLIGLLTLIASPFVSANTAITFPGENRSVPDAPITFPTSSKIPVTFFNGYTIKDGIFRSELGSCDIADNPEYEAKLIWAGKIPQLVILGHTNNFPYRCGFHVDFELDLSEFLHNIPNHILERLEVANQVVIQGIQN